jgi:hypothetical protein
MSLNKNLQAERTNLKYFKFRNEQTESIYHLGINVCDETKERQGRDEQQSGDWLVVEMRLRETRCGFNRAAKAGLS